MKPSKNTIGLAIALVLIVGAIAYLEHAKPKHTASAGAAAAAPAVAANPEVESKTPDFAAKAKQYPRAKELVAPDGYLNTDDKAITLGQYVGKDVVLLDFWTYSCINCQRTLPYLTSWYSKYKDSGLVIIGVHTPEFDFEKNKDNVAMALAKYGIKYPVVQDNEYATWDAYDNHYWPEHYLIDINGLVVDQHIGEGGYADTEALIQKLLQERNQVLGLTTPIPTGTVAPGEDIEAYSPETYFGAARNDYLDNGVPHTAGVQTLSFPSAIAPNKLYLSGTWNFAGESASTTAAGAGIKYSYDAKHVYIVAGSAHGADITVLRDGVPVDAQKGADVGAGGVVHIQEPRLYKLIDEQDAGVHTIEIRVNSPGLEAFTFTFG